jgi:hypothetical protein
VYQFLSLALSCFLAYTVHAKDTSLKRHVRGCMLRPRAYVLFPKSGHHWPMCCARLESPDYHDTADFVSLELVVSC